MFINIERQHESGVSRCKKLKILRKDDTNYLNKCQYLFKCILFTHCTHQLFYKVMSSSVRRTIILSRVLVILTIGVQCTVLAEYKKPVPSNGPCIDKIEVMSATLQGGHENCFGCSVAKDECGVGCQVLINSIYAACEGVTLPLYYYFDPPVSIC